jgi:small-conductance mechanosensitive channel
VSAGPITVLMRPNVWIPLAALLGGLAAAALVRLILLHYARKRGSALAATMTRHATRPLFLLLPLFLARFVQPVLDLEPVAVPTVRHGVTLLMIVAFAWVLISLIHGTKAYLQLRLVSGAPDDRRARRVLTRFAIVDSVLTVVIIVLTGAAMLVTFPEARTVGASILASAGIAGIVLGLAARPAAELLIAGLQIAFTEPFSLDDVVIVEGEWGRIEEITSTYVVVCIWDRRRLVLPLSYFLQKPFQNWTRSGTALLAVVTLEVDYSSPVEALRTAVGEIVTSSPLWSRESWNLQVTEAGERTMRLRIVASAANADHAWDLRCEIREKLITHLQQRYPWALPKMRATIERART